MEKKIAGIIGLIGAILVIVGLFLAWVSASGSILGTSFSFDVAGYNLAIGSITIMGVTASIPVQSYAILALVGGIIALIGAIGLLVGKRIIGFLLPIGGILAIAGAGWGFADVSNAIAGAGVTGATVSVGYGIYVCIVGGILALIGTVGLKGEK